LQERARFTVKQSRRFQCSSLIGSARSNAETQEDYKDTRSDFHSVRLKATRETGKKGIGEGSDLDPISC
jgi:hypothetical protein